MADFPTLPPFHARQANGDALQVVQHLQDQVREIWNLEGTLWKYDDLLGSDYKEVKDAMALVASKALEASNKLGDVLEKLKKQRNIIDWGFDTTWFPSADAWQNVLSAVGISTKRPTKKPGSYGWSWEGRGIEIVTAYDPFTGKRYDGGANDIGLAGYIGITGEKSLVKKVVSAIKKNAEGIKDESRNERDYI